MNNDTKKLEDFVDAPLKKVIAMLNLLGFTTSWSCCGFDYEGQPDWKDHTYGKLYIGIKFNNDMRVIAGLHNLSTSSGLRLEIVSMSCEIQYMLSYEYKGNIWKNKDSPHFHEHFNICISRMERFLYQYRDNFLEEVILYDENQNMNQHFRDWQFKATQPWVINKYKMFPELKTGSITYDI